MVLAQRIVRDSFRGAVMLELWHCLFMRGERLRDLARTKTDNFFYIGILFIYF